jgi:flagellar hook-basal body complex protein FliE
VTVTPFVPDAPLEKTLEPGPSSETLGAAFERALDGAGAALARADRAEQAFNGGRGGLQEMVVERAQADVLLAVAGAAASRAVQALNTILGMQI